MATFRPPIFAVARTDMPDIESSRVREGPVPIVLTERQPLLKAIDGQPFHMTFVGLPPFEVTLIVDPTVSEPRILTLGLADADGANTISATAAATTAGMALRMPQV